MMMRQKRLASKLEISQRSISDEKIWNAICSDCFLSMPMYWIFDCLSECCKKMRSLWWLDIWLIEWVIQVVRVYIGLDRCAMITMSTAWWKLQRLHDCAWSQAWIHLLVYHIRWNRCVASHHYTKYINETNCQQQSFTLVTLQFSPNAIHPVWLHAFTTMSKSSEKSVLCSSPKE